MTRRCLQCGEALTAPACGPTHAYMADRVAALEAPAGTLVTCEHCPTPHPKDDDARMCLFPKLVKES